MVWGMEKYGFLFALALIWVVFAVVQDMRKREVANWLNFSLVAFALAYRAFYSAYVSDWMFLVYGLFGFVLFYAMANLFYYSRVFAGGDAKLLMGIGVVMPFESFLSLGVVGGGFIVLLFAAGAVYSLIYSLFLVGKHHSKFFAEFKKNFASSGNWIFALIFVLLFVILVYALFGVDFWMILSAVLLAVFSLILIVYAKSLDVCMVKLVKARNLTEGDWLVDDVRLGKGVIKKTVHGLSAGDILKLRKAGKGVLVKEGIPFTPAFLLALMLMGFFWGVLEYLILSLL